MKKLTLISFGILFGIAATVTVFAAVQGFSDVKPTDWFYGPALEAQRLGIMNGVNGKFMPAEVVNRAQLAVILKQEKRVLEESTVSLLQNWVTVGGLLEGHHLYVYGTLFRQIPLSKTPGDDPRVIIKNIWTAKGFEKAFEVPETDKFKWGPFSIYAENGWQNKALSEFFIYTDNGINGVKWYGPFIDNVKRLQDNLADFK